MKAYTNLEQSKKLAEILPLESADMYYPNRIDIKYQGALPIEFKYGNPLLSQEIAAWSLAALLGVLPPGTKVFKSIVDNSYLCECPKCNIYKRFDNPVDACYEMISCLHEQNLI